MTHEHRPPEAPCVRPDPAEIETVAVERSVFFDGKFMNAADFGLDPHYLLNRHRLHNVTYHGWGVSDGLEVRPHPEAECRSEWVVIHPGLAVDPRGRELVVRRPLAVRVFGDDAGAAADGEEHRPESALLSLEYHQVGVDPVPVLCDDGSGKTVRDGRLREEPRPVVRHGVSERPRWPFEPPQVPLARLRRSADGRILVDMVGRPDLLKCPTRIVATSWRHGAELRSEELWAEPDGCGALVVTFSRDLARDSGLDAYTFVVEAGRPQGVRRPLRGTVRAEGPRAVFEIDRRDRPAAGESVFVTLKCDYVLDLRGYRVAGAPPRVPYNNPVPPGGLFESWFRVDGSASGGGRTQPASRDETPEYLYEDGF